MPIALSSKLTSDSLGIQNWEIGFAVDPKGVIQNISFKPVSIAKLSVTAKAQLPLLEKRWANHFTKLLGQGQKGSTKAFRLSGGLSASAEENAKLASTVFARYLEAMEITTMFDREERERTWADE